MDELIQTIASRVVARLIPELYEDEVFLWEIPSGIRFLLAYDPEAGALIRQCEGEPQFMTSVILESTRQLLRLPAIEVDFSDVVLNLDGASGHPPQTDETITEELDVRRKGMSDAAILEEIRRRMIQLGREPNQMEVASFHGVEPGIG